jgi:hypothetical protein
MLDQLKKYLKLKAEAMQQMQKGDVEGYVKKLRELYELRSVFPNSATVPAR